MGIFNSVKEAIFGKDKADKPTTRPTQAPAGQVRPAPTTTTPVAGTSGGTHTRQVSEVDVEQRLDGMSGADGLNWRSSIVDLLKLIGIDPSYANRKELAGEMGRTNYEGSADDNLWLHKRVMQELAKNGGRVPASLTD